MTEIEKMYENAGFKKDLPINLVDLDFSEEDCDELCLDNSCDECRYKTYPPFTAEKQLELIKWLSDTDYYINNIYKTIDTKEYCIENCYYDMQSDKFEETLAKLINKMWQSLTDKEKEEIRGILNE